MKAVLKSETKPEPPAADRADGRTAPLSFWATHLVAEELGRQVEMRKWTMGMVIEDFMGRAEQGDRAAAELERLKGKR